MATIKGISVLLLTAFRAYLRYLFIARYNCLVAIYVCMDFIKRAENVG